MRGRGDRERERGEREKGGGGGRGSCFFTRIETEGRDFIFQSFLSTLQN